MPVDDHAQSVHDESCRCMARIVPTTRHPKYRCADKRQGFQRAVRSTQRLWLVCCVHQPRNKSSAKLNGTQLRQQGFSCKRQVAAPDDALRTAGAGAVSVHHLRRGTESAKLSSKFKASWAGNTPSKPKASLIGLAVRPMLSRMTFSNSPI